MEIINHYLPSPDGGVVPEERPKFSGFVRPLQENDLEAVKPILETWIRNMMTGAIMPEEVEEDLQSMRDSLKGLNQQAYFVAEEAGRVTGLVGTQNPPKESLMQFARTQNPIELIRIYVSPEHTKGRGVGSALVDTVRAEARAKGFGEILLDSGPRYRHSGWGFHDKQFTRLGIVKDQYGPGIDARVWGEVLETPQDV